MNYELHNILHISITERFNNIVINLFTYLTTDY